MTPAAEALLAGCSLKTRAKLRAAALRFRIISKFDKMYPTPTSRTRGIPRPLYDLAENATRLRSEWHGN